MAEYETRRFTRLEYGKLIDLGVFRPGEAIELLGGQLVIAEPQGARHYTAIVKTARVLEAAFGAAAYVRMQGPIGLDDESEPEPDVAVVPGSIDDYGQEHPARAVLVVEVAQSSLAFDREYKGSLYARGGVPDYWVLNLLDHVLEVYRDPRPDAGTPFGWRYAHRQVLELDASVAPVAVPTARVVVLHLFP